MKCQGLFHSFFDKHTFAAMQCLGPVLVNTKDPSAQRVATVEEIEKDRFFDSWKGEVIYDDIKEVVEQCQGVSNYEWDKTAMAVSDTYGDISGFFIRYRKGLETKENLFVF